MGESDESVSFVLIDDTNKQHQIVALCFCCSLFQSNQHLRSILQPSFFRYIYTAHKQTMQVSGLVLRMALATMVASIYRPSEAFAPARVPGVPTALAAESEESSATALMENIPDLDELKSAPFMKQVGYGADMTEALTALGDDSSVADKLKDSLQAQLSHSDGIRGFMVSYLTGSYESSTKEDGGIDAAEMIAKEQDPQILLETVSGLLNAGNKEDSKDLVSLMCMNVVMPIAMITMHTDPALSEASRLTAARGIRLLGSVVNGSILENLQAIASAANASSDSASDDKLVTYWTEFFAKWGYEEAQKKDIAAAVEELLSKSSQEAQ